MVDFDAPEMYGKSSADLVQYGLIETRYNLLNSFEHARKLFFKGQTDLSVLSPIKAGLHRLVLEVWDEWARSLDVKDADEYIKLFLERVNGADSIDALSVLFRELEVLTDKLKITRLDKKGLGGNIVHRNKQSGLFG